MTYSLKLPNGAFEPSPITVPDNAIDQALFDSANNIGVQLVGRNAIDYGTAVAQNTVQMLSNFAGPTVPNDSISLQGQLWFKATSSTTGVLYVRNTTNASGGIANWQTIVTSDSSGNSSVSGNLTVGGDITAEGGLHVPVVFTTTTTTGALPGDIQVLTTPSLVISIYGGSPAAWNQVFPAVYS